MVLSDSGFTLKKFDQLSSKEVYQILQLRAEVFVLEQNCAYQDIDNLDQKSLHLYKTTDNNEIIAYARVLTPAQCNQSHCSIGRVVVSKNMRHLKLGKALMREAIKTCLNQFPNHSIKISAQTYLSSFYRSLGFNNTGKFYLEDDIPHQEMIYKH